MATRYLRDAVAAGLRVFDETKVAGALAATRFGPLLYVQETASTNDDAVGLLTDERNLGTIVMTEHQTHGGGGVTASGSTRPGPPSSSPPSCRARSRLRHSGLYPTGARSRSPAA